MILPTKHVLPQRSLLGMGAEILRSLDEPTTVASLWDNLRKNRTEESTLPTASYQWFVLTLDLLFMIGAIELQHGLLSKAQT